MKEDTEAEMLDNSPMSLTALGDGIGASLVYMTTEGTFWGGYFATALLIYYCASHNFHCGFKVFIKSWT